MTDVQPGDVLAVRTGGLAATLIRFGAAVQPKTPAQRGIVTEGARAILGMPYDWAAIIGDGLDDLHLWDPVGGVVRGAAVCSAVAAYLYDRAHLPRPAGSERSVQPAAWDEWIFTSGWSVSS